MRRNAMKLASIHQIKNIIDGVLEKKGSCRVLAPGNGATILKLDQFICSQAQKFAFTAGKGDIENGKGQLQYVQTLPLGDSKHWDAAGDYITHVSGFIGPANRNAVNNGSALFFLDDLSRAVKSLGRRWHPDIAIGHAAPESNGFYSMSLDGSLMRTGFLTQLEGQKTIRILIVNEKMPRAAIVRTAETWTDPVSGSLKSLESGCAVHRDDVDFIIEDDFDLIDFAMSAKPDPDWDAIGRHVVASGLIKDRLSDCQFGIGKTADGLIKALIQAGYTGLGIDTELIADIAVDGIKAGVFTGMNRDGPLRGRHIAGIVAGTSKLRDAIHDNPDFLILPQEWVNGCRRRSEHSFSINAAFGWTVFGDVQSTTRKRPDGTVEFFSAIGGQRELMQEIIRAGGTSIIATPSTYVDADGKPCSSITAAAPLGVRASTLGEIVQHLATEHGVVCIDDDDIGEIARKIISIADPRFRDTIAREAYALYPAIRSSFPGFTCQQAA